MLARYDAQLRRDVHAVAPARTERAGAVVRWLNDGAGGWEAVMWADIDESSADTEIARQIAFFTDRGSRFEWKHHAYDKPADLPVRLLAAGFVPEEAESLMVAETALLSTQSALPDGVRLVPGVDETGVDLVVQVHEAVFGTDHSHLGAELKSRLGLDPAAAARSGVVVVAMAGDLPVCSARAEFHEGTDFASLWGGGTLPEWRGRGIYRALVGYRAGLAAKRGYRYLTVDATEDSRPILERLGFVKVTTTTPYVYQEPRRTHSS